MHNFKGENTNIFLGSPDPTPTGEGDTPSPDPIPVGAFVASIPALEPPPNHISGYGSGTPLDSLVFLKNAWAGEVIKKNRREGREGL